MVSYTITESTTPNDATLEYIAQTPTEKLSDYVDPAFFKKLTDQQFMRIATLLAKKSYDQDGCPIGAVIIDNETRQIIGKGHNTMMQEHNSIDHGETSATKDAGRVSKLKGQDLVDFSRTTMFTTLTPCRVCCRQLNTRTRPARVVIGDVTNAPSTATRLDPDVMKAEILEDPMAVELYARYAKEHPDKHYTDWLGKAWYEQHKHLPPEDLLTAAIEENNRMDRFDASVLSPSVMRRISGAGGISGIPR